jgi:hypothetical protein
MTSGEVTEAFERAGWTIRGVGSSGEVVGEAGRYAIRPDEKVLGDETVFELRDEELDMKAYARRVPTPQRAAALLNEYGVPAGMSEVTPGKVPMVPTEAEVGS